MKKKLNVCLLAMACIIALTGCFCQHEWAEADCVNPKTCTLCEKTEGEALGHSWVDADCVTPKTCSACGLTEGAALGHSWVDADCLNPKTCSVCNEVEGEALGHNWLEATTEKPETCALCAETQGERIITDSRFTTARTEAIRGQWVANVSLGAEQMQMNVEGFDMAMECQYRFFFENDGKLNLEVEITNETEFKTALVSFMTEMTYAELEDQGFDRDEVDEAFLEEYGLTPSAYYGISVAAIDFNGMLSQAMSGISGVYYMAEGNLYTGMDWDSTAMVDIVMENGTLEIVSISESLGQPVIFTRVEE